MFTYETTIALPKKSCPHTIQFSPDGSHLAIATKGRELMLLDVAANEYISHRDHELPVTSIAVSTASKYIASIGTSNKAREYRSELILWNTETEETRTISSHPHLAHRCPQFLPASSRVLVKHGAIERYNAAKGTKGKAVPEQMVGDHFAISCDGKYLAFAPRMGMDLRVWKLDSESDVPDFILDRRFSEVCQISFSSDCETVASIDSDGWGFLHHVSPEQQSVQFEVPVTNVIRLATWKKPKQWLGISNEGETFLVDSSGSVTMMKTPPLNNRVAAVDANASSGMVAVAVRSGEIFLWKADDEKSTASKSEVPWDESVTANIPENSKTRF